MSDYRHMVWPLARNLPNLVSSLDDGMVFGNGVLKDVVTKRPFVIVKIGERMEAMADALAHSQSFSIWAHDDPGSFTAIDEILKAFQDQLLPNGEGMYHWPKEDPIAEEPWPEAYEAARAIGVRWAGQSGDLADDYYGTLVRYSSWQCVGGGP